MRSKVRKKATIRGRYNQIPLLTQDTTWESDKTQENITYKKDKRLVDHKAAMNRLDSMATRNRNNKKDPQKSTALERSVK